MLFAEKAEFHELLEGKDRLLQNIKKEYSMRNMLQEDQIDTLTLEISAMSSQLNDVKREVRSEYDLVHWFQNWVVEVLISKYLLGCR